MNAPADLVAAAAKTVGPVTSPQRTRRRGSALLIAAGCSLLAVVLLAIGGAAWHDRKELLLRASERNVLLARLFADSVTRSIDGAALANVTLAEMLQTGSAPDSAEVRAAMQQTLVSLPFLRAVAIIDAEGLVMGSTDPADLQVVIDLRTLGESTGKAMAGLGPYVAARRLSDLAIGRARPPAPNGVGFLPLLRTIRNSNGSTMLLVAMINVAAFANFQQTTLEDNKASASAVLTYDGRLIAATSSVLHPVGSDLSSIPPYRDFLPRLEHGKWTGTGLRSGDQVAAFRVSATQPLLVVVERSQADVEQVWWAGSRALMGAALGATLVIVTMTWVAVRNQRLRDAARDELDNTQAAVARREREFSVTLASLRELVFRSTSDGALTFVNERWHEITNTTADSALGQHLWDHVQPTDRAAVQALFDASGPAGVRRAQARITGAGVGDRHIEIAVTPLRQRGNGSDGGFAGSAIDITDRAVAQERLQLQLSFTEQLMDASPLPQSVMTTDRRYVTVNKAWEDFTGLRGIDVVGGPVGANMPPDEQHAHAARDRELVAHGRPLRYEARLTHRDGSVRDVVVNKLLLPSEEGKDTRILSVSVDVTEFRNAERMTLEARDAAEEMSRAKSEFVANMSHELRTPLQSIIGFSELGLLRVPHELRVNGMFGEIHGAGERMLRLVDDLLDVAKIESAVGTLALERTDLRVLVRELLRELGPLLKPKQLSIELDLPPEPLMAEVDPTRFKQVLRNVLANAIKFSPRQSRIKLRAEPVGDAEVNLSVTDAGPGIPPAELDKIFEAFVQSTRTKDGSGGTGLGLAICRKILEAHGGRITGENAPGGGAVFHIHVPTRVSAESAPTA